MAFARLFGVFVCVVVLLLSSKPALAMGEEHFGNAPLSAMNYKDWPGAAALINDPSRVYHIWVNGNEHFYYKSDTATLNEALKKFAAIETAKHEVLLRPGPGSAGSFDGKKQTAFDWSLHIVGGIAGSMSKLDKGDNVWNASPMLTVYVTANIRLDELQIPSGVTVLELADVAARCRMAMTSTEQEVRGWSAGHLAQLDPYDDQNLKAVIALLADKEPWVRGSAALVLPIFGKRAESAIPALQEAGKTADENLKKQIETAITKIQQSKDDSAAEMAHRESAKAISEFCQSLKLSKK
ncbi:MAG: HEAT repeat domain-containing protein [Burkholderiales bacterium]|nr:HEAT repeat domain-containing protein [Phycisphaerae bacterium]